MAEKAQVGDLIRVVDANPYEGEEYENGDIYEVLGRFGDGDVGVYVNKKDYFGDDLRLYDREYVIHRKAGEEDAEPKSRRLQKSCRQCGEYLNESHTFARSGYYFCGNYCADLFDGVNAGEEDALDTYQSEILGNEADAVNHPDHYTQGRFETIEIIEEITQGYSDGYVAYCVGNALKYLARAPFKHESPSEDIAKARAYLDFAIKRLGGEA